MPIQYPTRDHQDVLATITDRLAPVPAVLGVLVVGSLSRGTARADSDIDLAVICEAAESPPDVDQLLGDQPLRVDVVVRTAPQWREHFAPTRPADESWAYAFVDGVALLDQHGLVAELVDTADSALTSYRAPESVLAHYTSLWRRLIPQMRQVLFEGDPVEIGWAAAAVMDPLQQALWAINCRPLPPRDLGTLQRHLNDLSIPDGVGDRLRRALAAAPEVSLRLQLDLAVDVLGHNAEASRPTPTGRPDPP